MGSGTSNEGRWCKKDNSTCFPPNMFFCFCLSDTPLKGGIGVWGRIAPLPHLLTDWYVRPAR